MKDFHDVYKLTQSQRATSGKGNAKKVVAQQEEVSFLKKLSQNPEP